MKTIIEDAMVARKLDDFAQKGYTENFKVNAFGKLEDAAGKLFKPQDVRLDEIQRLENTGNSSNSVVFYALQTNTGAKGCLVSVYTANESREISEFMNQVK